MTAMVQLYVNGKVVEVPEGTNVAAAVAQVSRGFRRSCTGTVRAPLCGMGVCYECRVTVDGEHHVRACTTPARQGMQVNSDG